MERLNQRIFLSGGNRADLLELLPEEGSFLASEILFYGFILGSPTFDEEGAVMQHPAKGGR